MTRNALVLAVMALLLTACERDDKSLSRLWSSPASDQGANKDAVPEAPVGRYVYAGNKEVLGVRFAYVLNTETGDLCSYELDAEPDHAPVCSDMINAQNGPAQLATSQALLNAQAASAEKALKDAQNDLNAMQAAQPTPPESPDPASSASPAQ